MWLDQELERNVLIYFLLYFVKVMLSGCITYPKVKYICMTGRDHLMGESCRRGKFKSFVFVYGG